MAETRSARCSFIAIAHDLHKRCRRARKDVLTNAQRAQLLDGFRAHHAKLQGVPAGGIVGAVRYSHRGRPKGCFFAPLASGTRVWLSYKCRSPTPEQRLNSLLRRSVRAQTDAVRLPQKPEVDHHGGWPFEKLKRVWMARTGVSREQLLASKRLAADGTTQTIGEPWLGRWRKFHARRATLRPISRAEHVLKTRRMHLASSKN